MGALLFLAALVACPLAAQPSADAPPDPDDRATWAPTAQGVRLLGGHASASAFSGDFAGASLEPVVGRFVADGLALSLRLGVHASCSSSTSVDLVGGVLTEEEIRSASTA